MISVTPVMKLDALVTFHEIRQRVYLARLPEPIIHMLSKCLLTIHQKTDSAREADKDEPGLVQLDSVSDNTFLVSL